MDPDRKRAQQFRLLARLGDLGKEYHERRASISPRFDMVKCDAANVTRDGITAAHLESELAQLEDQIMEVARELVAMDEGEN